MAIEFKIIKIRKNIESAFVPSNLLPGELHITTDTGKVHYCYSAGNVKQLATIEQLQELLNISPEAYLALQQLISDLEDETVLTGILNDIVFLNTNKLDKTGDSKDNVVTFTESTTDTNAVSGEKVSIIIGKFVKSIKTFRSAIGTLSSLTTTVKTNLVAAINELKTGLDSTNSEVDTINDSLTQTNTNVTNQTNRMNKYEPTSTNTLNITEADLYNRTTPGNYSVYLTSVTGSVFTKDTLHLLEVRAVFYGVSGNGFVQEMTQVYPNTVVKKRRVFYSVGGWSNWV